MLRYFPAEMSDGTAVVAYGSDVLGFVQNLIAFECPSMEVAAREAEICNAREVWTRAVEQEREAERRGMQRRKYSGVRYFENEDIHG